jgi:N-methylhydantoinase B
MSFRDGVSTGGYPFDPKAIAPNVEFNEQQFPIVYLHRRELPDSAGSGRFRGGACASWAFIPHETEEIALATSGGGIWAPSATGMWGGGTATTMRFTQIENSDVKAQFARRHIASEMDEIGGETIYIEPKATGIVQGSDDVVQIHYPGAAGYGDPLERDPKLVAADVDEAYVSPGGARRDYFCAVAEGADGEWSVDEPGTAKLREEEIERRRASANAPGETGAAPVTTGHGTVEMGDAVRVELDGGSTVFSCRQCDHELGRDLLSYKDGAVFDERLLIDTVPGYIPGDSEEAAELVLREHFCPGCLRRLDAEIVRRSDPSLVDVEIWTPAGGAKT